MMKQLRLLLLFISFTVFTNIYSQQGEWEVYDEMDYPVARGQIVVHNDIIYILGGYSGDLQMSVNWIQKYNPIIEEVWKVFGYMQLQRVGFIAGDYQDGIYYCGGVLDGITNYNSMEKWEYTQTGTFADTDENFARMYSTGLILSGDFFIIGGNPSSGGTNLPYIVSYNFQSQSTTVLENNLYAGRPLPEHQMSAAISNDIYIFGGVIYTVSQDIYKFDTNTNTIEKLPISLLQPRAAGSAVAIPSKNKIYIMGGFNENSNSLNSVEIFEITPSGYEIMGGPELNYARSACMAGKTSTDIFIMGGYDTNGNVVPCVEKLDLTISSVEDDRPVSRDFELLQNYPNPFNLLTNINISLQKESDISLDIYSVLGEHVINLVNSHYGAGAYTFQWDGKDKSGNVQPSGIYFYSLTSNTISQSKKMILLK
ncbi:T9SS type A sorting domain-containing protein [Bacteroidota bacterium]